MTKNPYDILGVKTDASPEQIKKAFRSKAKAAHPDTGGTAPEFHAVEKAYAILANPVRRERFDKTGETEDEATFQKMVAQNLQRYFVSAVMQADFTVHNLVQKCREFVRGKISDAEREKESQRLVIRKFTLAIARVSRKNSGENIIVTAFEGEIKASEFQIAACDKTISLFNAMLVELDLYEWRTDAPHLAVGHQTIWGQHSMVGLFQHTS